MDHQEWPSLGSSSAETPQRQAGDVEAKDNGDWELLAIDEAEDVKRDEGVILIPGCNPKFRRNSASSPDLRRFVLDDVIEEGDEEGGDGGSSFAMVRGPASVLSATSGLSFRDAILASNSNGNQTPDAKPSSRVPPTVPTAGRKKIRPRFVVTPIRRSVKSTGDLQSLVIQEEDEEDVLGDTDAMEFYHRKAQGVKGRANGMKLRPDEAKRKQMTMYKKDLQRQANAKR